MSSLDKFLADHPAVNRKGQQKYTTAVWGGVSSEFDTLKDNVKIVSSDSSDVNNLTGDMLDELILRFTGIPRATNQLDEVRIKTLFAFFRRSDRKSWVTRHAIIGAYRYYFPADKIYLLENVVETNLIADSGFEAFEAGVKTAQFGNWIPTGTQVEVVTEESFQGAKSVKLTGTGKLSQTVSFAPSSLVLTTPYRGSVDVTIQRLNDNYYYDFASKTWSSTAKKLSLENNGSTYQINESHIVIDSTQNVKITYSLGSTGSACFIDELSVGQKPSYPYIKVIVSTSGQNGDFMNNWQGNNDPIAGLDYNNATFFGIDYIGGDGGGVPTSYYQKILDYIKPAGVKAVFEFVGRG